MTSRRSIKEMPFVTVEQVNALRAEALRLDALNAELLEALVWMVENDDTFEGDEPVDRLGGASWNDYNAYWIAGLNRARAAIAKATGAA